MRTDRTNNRLAVERLITLAASVEQAAACRHRGRGGMSGRRAGGGGIAMERMSGRREELRVMLAEPQVPDPRGSGATWPPPPLPPPPSIAATQDAKEPGHPHRPRAEGPRRPATSRKSCFLGLETKPELVWEDWDLGRDIIKTLVLKNTNNERQKLHLRPPETSFFTVLCPQIVFLSPGMTVSIPVSFRALQRCEYEDSVEFQSEEGSFQVRLHATIHCLALEVPDSVQLPSCAVQHSSQTTFRLRNASKLQTAFQLACAAPFRLSPDRGLLRPCQECQITVVFRPQEALMYREKAHCRFGKEKDKAESWCTVLLQGLARCPRLQLRVPADEEGQAQGAPVLRFGSVPLGQSLQRHFEIFNPSPVTTCFSLSHLSGGVPLLRSEFSCDVTRGEVAPGGSLRATVIFSPAVVDKVTVEYLSLKCRGAVDEDLLKLTGSCVGPKVSLSSSVLDFGCARERQAVVQTVELVNSSPVEAVYQWDLDCSGHSVFSIQPACGTVQPHGRTTLKAVYRPTTAIVHHRRVACLVLHRDPLFLDLIGTCHSELLQPAVLKPEHLVLSQLQWYRGAENEDLDQQDQEPHQRPGSSPAVPQPPMEEFYQSSLGCMDPLAPLPSSPQCPHVSVRPNELLFNHTVSSAFKPTPCAQSVSITNYTHGRLSLVWTVAQDSQFTVSPSSCDLAPLKSTSFRVTYDPKQLNTLHGAQLECFAFYKMDSRHMGERLLCPPWCVTVRVVGHSFQPGKEHFVPWCSLTPPEVVFPGLSAVSYKTVLLQNSGDMPLTFCVDLSSNPALAGAVSVVPHCGLIRPGLHQIITLRSTPTEDGPEEGFALQLQLNAAKHIKELTVVSVIEKLCVSLEGDGSVYFPPTAVGSQTHQAQHIRNLCRLPLRFQWSIPEPDWEFISVEPDAGELHPNEISIQTWSFSPLEEKTYKLKPVLTFWPSRTNGEGKSPLTLKVVGMGFQGILEAQTDVLKVEDTLVGSNQSVKIPLVNSCPCSVSFQLSVQQTLLDEELESDPEAEPCALHLDSESGVIAPRCTLLLQSTFRPHRRGQYLWRISYQTLSTRGSVSTPPQAVCDVQARGVFPTLQVANVCGGGSCSRLSKTHLWTLFSLGGLNRHLLSSPSPAELNHRAPTKHRPRSWTSTLTKAKLDFNFSAAAVGSEPSAFTLMFHNPGSIPVDWAFLFPEDRHTEFNHWAGTGQFNNNELSQMKFQECRLFSVSPRAATLQPGQQMAVDFSYSHAYVGTNRFPVVLKISHGREILLHFQGVTVERNRPYLHFASKRHVFTSVPIGDCYPPRQVYKLYNAGTEPVHYEVDTAMLSQLQMENFNHPVLCCLSPGGDVPPGRSVMLEWIFSPLEAKLYHMDVFIHVKDGDSTLVTFEGLGLGAERLEGSWNAARCRDTKESGPCVQRVLFPGQLVLLSADRLALGDIPFLSESSRILFLTNVSLADTVRYTWDLPQQSNQQVVQIHPERGRLSPGESSRCVLTFTSTQFPTVYQLDLICQVVQEAALRQYHKALQHFQRQRQREQDEFTITEKDLSEKEPVTARKEPPFSNYKIIPPIHPSSCAETEVVMCPKRRERQAQRQMAKINRQPAPLRPALLHLEVTAHSHGLLDYSTHFPGQINKLFRRLRSGLHKPKSGSTSIALPVRLSPSSQERICVHVLTTVLWSILEDSAFAQSLFTEASRSVVYHPTEPAPPQRSAADGAGTAPVERASVDMSKDVLLDALQHLMMEAVRGELDLTAPVPTRTLRMSRASTEEDS